MRLTLNRRLVCVFSVLDSPTSEFNEANEQRRSCLAYRNWIFDWINRERSELKITKNQYPR